MKTIKKILATAVFSGFTLSIVLSSCQKKFDAGSYAPPKPPPSYGGYVTSSEVASANLVAHWAFNGSYIDSVSNIAATPTDTLGNSSPGTSFGKGIKNEALTLSGNATYLLSAVPPNIQSLHSFSVSLWVNMPQTTGATEIFSIPNGNNFWGNLDLYWNSSTATTGQLAVQLNDNASTTTGVNTFIMNTVSSPWSKWVNIIITYDDTASAISIYYQGQLQAQGGKQPAAVVVSGFAPLNWTGSSKVIFGAYPFLVKPSLTTAATPENYGGWAAYVNGSLYDVRVYNTVLTSVQVTALYNLQTAGR